MPDHTMRYIESDVPAGLTLAEWRRMRRAGQAVRTRRFSRLWPLAAA